MHTLDIHRMHIPQKTTVQRGTLATNIATKKMLGSVKAHFAKQVMLTLFIDKIDKEVRLSIFLLPN